MKVKKKKKKQTKFDAQKDAKTYAHEMRLVYLNLFLKKNLYKGMTFIIRKKKFNVERCEKKKNNSNTKITQ